MEGEENKLTTFSTWTIMLGCNESSIIFQQHLCKLGQLRALLCSSNPGPEGSGARRTHAILSRDRTEDDETFCTALPIHLRVPSMHAHTHTHTPDTRAGQVPLEPGDVVAGLLSQLTSWLHYQRHNTPLPLPRPHSRCLERNQVRCLGEGSVSSLYVYTYTPEGKGRS